ncbi:50S ribosomal protein L16 [Candidatus Woesearchaeota archaeon]|nr:50S ribosomal protein L16 [Candidatus Woesearchaeota archaeon]MBW3022273.1 50S ribosomal protein L16 [Candidatus Woesearchaeota archaeon]
MARLRKATAYRQLKRPYTRISKFRKKSYIRARPNITLVKYDMGDSSKQYDYRSDLISSKDLNLRHNCLESARQVANRVLEKVLGKTGYHLKIRVFPHHIIRENPLAAGAGADRMSTGMKMSFGKAISTAARVRRDQIVISVYSDKNALPTIKTALKRANSKLPCTCKIEQKKL